MLALPADTRRVRLLAPDGMASMLVKFDSALPDGGDDPRGRLVTEWIGAAAVVAVPGGVWGAVPAPRAYLDDGEVVLAFNWGDGLTVRQTDIAAGDYLVLKQREGVEWDAANPVLERTVYGRFMVRNGSAYETSEDFLEMMIERLRDAIVGGVGKGPASAALIEVEAPDGRREKYTGIGALQTQLFRLENRLAFLRSTDGGRTPMAGFRLRRY